MMVKVKMSENGKFLPLFPFRHSAEKSPITLEMKGLSAVFHIAWPTGTPLAFTEVYGVPDIRCIEA